MTTLERWVIATLAAATVVVTAAGGTGEPSEPGYQENRQRIEDKEPGEKRQLYEKWQRFQNLSPDKQEELRTLHRELQAQGNREELERVMEAYFEWVCTLSASERSQLDGLSPQERVKQVIKYKTSPRRQFGRRDGLAGNAWSPGGRIFGRGRPPAPDFVRDYVESLKTWAGRYVIEHADHLATLLPPSQAEKWKAGLEKTRSEDPEVAKTEWIQLVRWYLAGPNEDLPLDQENVAELEGLMKPEIKKWFDRLPPEGKIGEIRNQLGRIIWHLFYTRQPEVEDLISTEELDRFSDGLPREQQENLARLSDEKKVNWLRFLYFTSKLPAGALGFRSEHGPFTGGGGPPQGPPNHDGQGPRRGPGGEVRDRGDGPRGMRSDRPEMPPPRVGGPVDER